MYKRQACVILEVTNSDQMKNLGFFLPLLLCLDVTGQSVFTNQTNAAIEKVIRDYPNQFRNIRGSLLLESQESTNYQSHIQIPGALSCVVTRYNVSNKSALAWKAELFESSSFHEAKEKYQDLFAQIRNTIIKIEGEKPYILNGQYEIPAQEKRFHSVVFNMLPAVGGMQKVKVELSLVRQSSAWKVNILIYDQDTVGGQELVSGD